MENQDDVKPKESEKSEKKSKISFSQKLSGILALTVVFLWFSLFILIYNLGKPEFSQAPEPLFISGGISIGVLIFWIFLEKRKKQWEIQNEKLKLSRGKRILKGIFKVTAVISVYLIVGVILAAQAAYSLDPIDTQQQKNFIIYSISAILFLIIISFIFFGSKSIYNSLKHIKVKKRGIQLLSAMSTLFLVLGSFGMGNFNYYFIDGTLSQGTGHTDGPWLTWSSDPTTSICITYFTEEKNDSIVYYGTDPLNLDKVATGERNSYIHHIEITGLEPDTTYYYRIPENFEANHSSALFSFTTAPTSPRPYKFAIVGDMQPHSGNLDLLRTGGLVADGLINGSFDFICQLGDAVSSGSNPEDYHWLMNAFSRFGANTPVQAVIGNHDWSGMSGSVNWGNAFRYNFVQKDTISKYYSFDYLNSHFVMIDNFEVFYSMTDAQLEWIRNDIRDAHTRGQDWIFAMFHLSMMTVSTSGWYSNLQAKLIPIFDEEGVDAVFYGHDHDYQHYNYTYGNNDLYYSEDHDWEHKPIQYFCTGGGGASLEVDYGNLNERETTYEVEWFNESRGEYQTISYIERNWNASKYLTHDNFAQNYTQYSPDGIHNNKYYYYYPPYEDYSELAQLMGFDYGEQAYHFIQIEIDGKQCTISATYPNGVILSGPNGINPQSWTFTKD